jgi:hypothetical protein
MYGGASALWILVRAILLSSTGYLHPDQIFQAQEPMFAFLYPNHTPAPKVPWEYSVDAPIRCSLFPSICAMVPYWIVGADSSSIAAFIAPRVVMVLAMIYAEASLRRICFNMGISSKGVLWIFQSSWAGLVIGARPFSNTAEMWMLVVLLRVLSRSQFQVRNIWNFISVLICFQGFEFDEKKFIVWYCGWNWNICALYVFVLRISSGNISCD